MRKINSILALIIIDESNWMNAWNTYTEYFLLVLVTFDGHRTRTCKRNWLEKGSNFNHCYIFQEGHAKGWGEGGRKSGVSRRSKYIT